MKVNDKKELIYKIKVNKKLTHRKSENNLKINQTPSQAKTKLNYISNLKQRNSFSKRTKNLSDIDFDANENYIPNHQYSQMTYTSKYFMDDISYKKGNIIYDMQKNKYLKPILDSKDFYKKIFKCRIDSPSNLFLLSKDDIKKSLSALSSPKFKESLYAINNNYKIKKEKNCNKNAINLLNNLKEFNSNFPIQIFRNSLYSKEIKSVYNNSRENLNNSDTFNNLNNNQKNSKTCKNFYNKKAKFSEKNNLSYRCISKYKTFNKPMKEKIEIFCYILEIFFLNIIKAIFNNFINKINTIKSKDYSKEKIYNKLSNETISRKNTFYDTQTIRNTIIDSDTIKTNILANINYYNIYETNKIIKDNAYRFDRDIIGNSKDKKHNEKKINNNDKHINNTIIKKDINSYRNIRLIENKDLKRNKKKLLIFRKINNDYIPNDQLIYKKKTNISRKDFSIKKEKSENSDLTKSEYSKKIKNNALSFNVFENNSVHQNKSKIMFLKNNIRNKIEKEYNLGEIKKRKLFYFFNYYTIRDRNYIKSKNKKYNNSSAKYKKYRLNIFKNIDFSIMANKRNIYKKINIYINDKRYNNKKYKTLIQNSIKTNNLDKIYKKYDINFNTIDKKNCSKNNNEILLSKKYFLNQNKSKYDNVNRNKDINKIFINCVKLLTKIITKLYIKKKFHIFKQSLALK